MRELSTRTETCDFWVGSFPDEDAFWEYFGKSDEYYRKFDENPAFVSAPLKRNPRTPGTLPLSRFIGDQGHDWYDHSMAEMGFNARAKSIAELVDGYSYSDQWANELASRVARRHLHGINAFCFIRIGTVEVPRSVSGPDFLVEYMGTITYRI